MADSKRRTRNALRLLAGGSALAIATGPVAQAQDAAEGDYEDVALQIEGRTVNVSLSAAELRDHMDDASAGGGARGADRTNAADSGDNSGKDKGDSVRQSPAHTGQNEGDSATQTTTGKMDSGDRSANDQGDSKGESVRDTGKDTPDASATGVHDSGDNSCKDVGDSYGHSVKDTGKDTAVIDSAASAARADRDDSAA